MIIFLSGFPFAGKSFVVNEIVTKLPTSGPVIVIDPKQYRCDNYEELSEDQKRDENLAVWEVSLDALYEQIKKLSNRTILFYDTACACRSRMEPLFRDAKRAGHHVIYLFVSADLGRCEQRAGSKWLPQEVIDKYIKNFEENITEFKRVSHKMFIVNNDTDETPDVTAIIDYILTNSR
jgi:tRNA uridine 5-carbamoylmethylation protein Kti12